MLNKEILTILEASKPQGWVMEPEAKKLFRLAGLPVPRYFWAKDEKECAEQAEVIGYPLVAKAVSPQVVHKSESRAVEVGISNADELRKIYKRFVKLPGFDGVLIEETVAGLELIIGAKNDYQFGPVVLLGIGGTGVEIYKDTVLRMAPLLESDANDMLSALKAHALLEGYRGAAKINRDALVRLLVDFSTLIMELESVMESIDLNPVFCNEKQCIIADARIMLRKD